jgi:hypothetical protein
MLLVQSVSSQQSAVSRSSLYGEGLIADGKLRYVTIRLDSELIPDVSVCNTAIKV